MDYSSQIDELLDGMAKPPGSLGLLEKHFKKVLFALGTELTELKPHHLIFAADNGVVEEGVAAYPPVITYLQAQNMVAGHATISSFCHCQGVPYTVVDVGVNSTEPVGVNRKAACGTRNFTQEPAMTKAEYAFVQDSSAALVNELVTRQGCNLLSFGEMGIGNTTTSSAVLHALTGAEAEFVVGYGASAPSLEIIKRKRSAIARGMALHKDAMATPHDILRCLGGFDLVAMCSAMRECARLHIPFVIDGFIAAVAYACAVRIDEQVKYYAIPSHLSKEPGMVYAMLAGGVVAEEVPLRANMALGEGTGAVLMVGLLKTMAYAVRNTARLSDFDLGVSGPQPAAEGGKVEAG